MAQECEIVCNALYIYCRYTQPGDFVLDVFGGVGTTAVTAAFLGRHGISFDKDRSMALAVQQYFQKVCISRERTVVQQCAIGLMPCV